MPITTRTVLIQTSQVLGAPLPRGRVHFLLSAPDTEGQEVIVPRPVPVDLDDQGDGSVELWPNSLGANGTHYRVTVRDRYNRVRLEASAVMPDSDNVPLTAMLALQPAPPFDAAQAAVLAAQAAAAQAEQKVAEANALAAQAQARLDEVQGTIDGLVAGFVHQQGVPAAVWTVDHNMGKYPSVTVEDSLGEEVEGEVHYDTLNRVRIVFSAGFSGRAILN